MIFLSDISIEEQDNVNLAIYNTNTYIYFHVTMLLASIYMTMFLTNWK